MSFSRCSPSSTTSSPASSRVATGEDDLPACPAAAIRAHVHVAPDVALLGEQRRPRMYADPNLDRPRGSASVISYAAAMAPGAVGKAKKNASPCVSTSTPSSAAQARGSPAVLGERLGIGLRPDSRKSFVEPSTSVKRKVTVPEGRSPRTGAIMR